MGLVGGILVVGMMTTSPSETLDLARTALPVLISAGGVGVAFWRWIRRKGLQLTVIPRGRNIDLQVINRSANVAFLARIGGRLGNVTFEVGDFGRCACRLEPGEVYVVSVPRSHLVRPGLRWLAVWDSVGRSWKAPASSVRALLREPIRLDESLSSRRRPTSRRSPRRGTSPATRR